ncbi:ribosomal protein L11 methylase [Caldimicrobium thiodismutans]|uniref:Ribosomal protein L11 methylase n=1 Tax=Caldimicrobium thiodismutans TaxID=1653476 RepID=A0A0U5AZE4_9BACT|nr:50S ribosomal protein L11 methyltransferase [Caldimicrobium thiodismutans]BAU23871.1 ribosomal protein L11 methylase [Caldimicrobium thiodismutans]
MLRPPYQKYETFYIYGFRDGHPALRVLDDPDLIGYWEEDGIGVLFFHKPKDALVQELINQFNLTLEIKDEVPYTQWNERRIPQPFEVGPFKIAPLWYEGKWDLIFDPSVVFGEGTHPTTTLMLHSSWNFYKLYGLPESILDLGCGSGILTLFWAKLGGKIRAIDINPLCVKVTQKNLSLNGLQAQVQEGDVREFKDFACDLLLANLYKGLLLDQFKREEFFSAKYYLLSGFTIGMEEEIIDGLEEKPVRLLERKQIENWVCYLLCRI